MPPNAAEQLFQVPSNWESYFQALQSRIANLIDCQVWTGIHPTAIDSWLANFRTPPEQYFAARILDELIYRSEAQTLALVDQLFLRSLPDLLLDQPISGISANDIRHALSSKSDPGIRIVPVVHPSDPPTKSGYVIVRMIQRHLGIDTRWIIQPSRIPKVVKRGIKALLFVDDFLGTGTQFKKFFAAYHLASALGTTWAAYVPLAAHETGVFDLHQKCPKIHVTAAEFLDHSTNIFSGQSGCFNDGVNTWETGKHFYVRLKRKFQITSNRQMVYGFGKLGLVYAFAHGTPNACIPLLWCDGRRFTRLLSR